MVKDSSQSFGRNITCKRETDQRWKGQLQNANCKLQIKKTRMAKLTRKAPLVCSFGPISAADARVLVLGTAPSIASLAKQQYYGHAQNAFWPIMGRLFGAGRELPYEVRKAVLCANHVAVWDVFRECFRVGSLDSAIDVESESPNEIAEFLESHRDIHTIFFNGQKAETAFRRHVLLDVARIGRTFRYVRLPSTSPAHAGRTFAEKLSAWQAVARAARRSGVVE
jgi:double-stranded uracil-DNA glycosylase